MNTRTDENAIQSDATTQQESQNSGANNEESAVHTPSAREIAMEAISAQRLQSLAADGVDMAGTNEGGQDNASTTQLAAQLGQDDRPTMAADVMRVKVKVDGEELELPLSEVVKSYQKDAAASKRLQEATRLLQFAEQQASKLAQNENQENNPSSQMVDSQPQDKEARRGKIKDAFSKLYEGDEDGAVEAMLQIVGESGAPAATQSPVIDTQAIAAQVRQQLDVESAYSETRLDYPELFSDTERGVVLGRETLARMTAKESIGISRSQAMHESAAEVAALFGIQKAGRQTSDRPRTARDTKLERKANLDIPDSANVVAGNKQSPAEAPNVSSVIAEMAKSRLGQSLNAR